MPIPTLWWELYRALDSSDEMDDLYRDYILEHYRRPHNFGVLDGADASYEGANPLCGDRITLSSAVDDGVVDGVGFTGRGCAISQASASLLTDEIKGKPLADVAELGRGRARPARHRDQPGTAEVRAALLETLQRVARRPVGAKPLSHAGARLSLIEPAAACRRPA